MVESLLKATSELADTGIYFGRVALVAEFAGLELAVMISSKPVPSITVGKKLGYQYSSVTLTLSFERLNAHSERHKGPKILLRKINYIIHVNLHLISHSFLRFCEDDFKRFWSCI